MPAYVIADIEVREPAGYAVYRKMAQEALTRHGGRFLVRGGHHEIFEGDWVPSRLVVLEFDSVEQAKKWWESEEYRPAKQLRQRTAKSSMLVVEGV